MNRLQAEFKHSEAGLVPRDWEVKRIGEFLKFYSGKAHEQYISQTGRFVVVNSKFVSTDGKVRKHSTKNFLSARVGDVLMVMSDLPNGRALAKCFLVDRNDFYAVNQRVCIFRSRSDDPRYLRYVLNRNPYFMAFDDGVQQTHLLNDPIKKCPVILPPVGEQRAIADVLADAERHISILERLIAKKQAIKQGMMQELLTGKTRLPEFTDQWQKITLGSALDKLESGVSVNSISAAGTYSVLKTSCVYGGTFDQSECKTIAPTDIKRAKLNPRQDSLIISRMNTPNLVGEVGYVPHDFPDLFVPDRLWMATTKPGSAIYMRWLAHLLSSVGYAKAIKELASGTSGSMKNISKGSFLNLEIVCPSREEQIAIAQVLTDLDDGLATLQLRLLKAKEIKQGMMQELLTGRTRLLREVFA